MNYDVKIRLKIPKINYSETAKHYDKLRPLETEIWLSKIIEFGSIKEEDIVLDFGCGTGRYTLNIFKSVYPRVCGLDVSNNMIKQALEKDKDKNVYWINADGQKLPFRSDSFDCLYMTLVMHQIQNREEALKDIYRTLKIMGRIVTLTNSHARLKRHLLSHFSGVIKKDLDRFPTILTIKKTMKSIGFTHVEYKPIEYNEYISRMNLLKECRINMFQH